MGTTKNTGIYSMTYREIIKKIIKTNKNDADGFRVLLKKVQKETQLETGMCLALIVEELERGKD